MYCPMHGSAAGCYCRWAKGTPPPPRGFFWALAAVLALAGGACGLLPSKAPAADPCSAEIVRLEGLRDAEVLAACAGQEFDACLSVAVIDRKYDPLIRAQIECAQ